MKEEEEQEEERSKNKKKTSKLSLKRKRKNPVNEKVTVASKISKINDNQKGGAEDSPFTITRPPTENYFTLELFNSKSFHKSDAAQELTYKAKLKYPAPDLKITDLSPHLNALFQTLLDEMRKKYGNSGIARIYIDHPNLEKAIIVVPTALGDLDPKNILDYIDWVVESAGEIPADEELDINVAVIRTLQGSGRKHVLNLDDLKHKRSLIQITNEDNACLPRAIVVGLAHLNMRLNSHGKTFRKKYDQVRNCRNTAQGKEACELMSNVGIDPSKPGCLTDVKLYEDYLKVNICVISHEYGKRVYNGSNLYKSRIFLLHSGDQELGHFDLITKVNGMMNTQYYCEDCGKGFKSKSAHTCKIWCNVCGRKSCKFMNAIKCADCNRTCRSNECFKMHKKKQTNGRGRNKGVTLPSQCEKQWQCPNCGITLKTNQRNISLHECGEVQCTVCYQYYIGDSHQCYMRAVKPNRDSDKFIFYDFECQQDNDKGKHIPNFVVAHSVCQECEDNPVTADAKCNNCGSRCEMCDSYNKKLKEWEKYPCRGCGKRQVIFSGPKTQNDFGKWLVSERHRDVTAIAHNGRAYDAYFIYNYLISNGVMPEPVIFSGSKIMYMHIQKINMRFLDSLNFLPMPLAKLPKSFGLEEMKKGFFPHFFNTAENENTILPCLPDMKYYDPDSMSKDRREEFLQWYEQNKNKEFDFQKEMREYCISDVDILQKACCKFKELVMGATGTRENIEDVHNMIFKTISENAVDPFAFLTIASVCMGVFRSKFLKEDWLVLTKEEAMKNPNCNHDLVCGCEWVKGRKSNAFGELEVLIDDNWISEHQVNIERRKFVKSPIAIIPQHGYSGDRHSRKSIEWLSVLQKEWCDNGKIIQIQHARSPNGEKTVIYKGKTRPVRYKLDGYFEYNGQKYACEYYGCNWHGCPNCFPRDREIINKANKSLAQRYRETVLKEQRLKELGYIIINVWSCDFETELVQDNGKRTFVKSLNIEDPINLRECYFGGRTNALIMHKEFKEGEKGYYVDFTSLYPDVLKYKRYPVGHPERITDKFKGIITETCQGNCIYANCKGEHLKLQYFGLMKARFIPPTNLLHPVLPVRCNGKLKFPLCLKCARIDSQEECRCSISDRSFVHTYCTPEIEVALNMGYIISEIYEILHWPETNIHNPADRNSGLFTEYINTFLKLKQQASGYPQDVTTELEKDEYIRKYYEHEGILLEKDMIEKNPGLRSISKLALNSFYGKFGQRNNMTKTKFINDVGDLYNALVDFSKVLSDFHVMNENVMLLEFKNSEDFDTLSTNTNVLIAAFCTTWARIKLWGVMNMLGDRVLYHDTDSIIFSVKDTDEYIPPLGEYLGDLTNEITCKEVGCKGCLDGHWIAEFISCGPKNYTYKLNTGQICCKVRGFSLNYRNSQIINFQSMKDTLYAWINNQDTELVTVKTEIYRNKYENPIVYTREIKKTLQCCV